MTSNMYPRKEGHCLSHHIPKCIVSSLESYDKIEETIPDFDDDDNNDNDNDSDFYQNYIVALNYLKSMNADLVKGDLILFDCAIGYRNQGVAIFDGEQIIDLEYDVDDYGALPSKFHVIENGVPLNYWSYVGDTDATIGIDHNQYVWFNHVLVWEQCVANLTYGQTQGKYAIYTSFMFEQKQYKIMFEYHDAVLLSSSQQKYGTLDNINRDTYQILTTQLISMILQKCKNMLTSLQPIIFEFSSYRYSDHNDNRTLFVYMNF